MPTYEYRCDHCDRNFDVVQSFQDDPLTRCPTCDSPVRKVFGNVGIVFKGAGFYKNDSRDGSRAKGSSRTDITESTDGGSKSSENDKGAGSSTPATGGGSQGADKKGASSSDSGNGKSPAPATSTSS